LRANRRTDLRVFIVWEPVLATDWGTPSPSLTGQVADPRVTHFWDHDRRLSSLYGGAARLAELADVEHAGFRMQDILWDAALVYPPGSQWGSRAQLLVAPVVKFRRELAGALP
jgi:hypothetical protein